MPEPATMIPVIHHGDPDDRAFAHPPVTHVWVSHCHMQSEHGGYGNGSQVYGVCVYAKVGAEAPHPGEIWRQMVRGESRWEPTTINMIGDRGAYRDMPPETTQIDRAIAEAKRRIGNYLRTMPRLKRATPAKEEIEIGYDREGDVMHWRDTIIPAGTLYFLAQKYDYWDPRNGQAYATIETPGYHVYRVRHADLH